MTFFAGIAIAIQILALISQLNIIQTAIPSNVIACIGQLASAWYLRLRLAPAITRAEF